MGGVGRKGGNTHARAQGGERKIERIGEKETRIMREGVEKRRRSTTSVCQKKAREREIKAVEERTGTETERERGGVCGRERQTEIEREREGNGLELERACAHTRARERGRHAESEREPKVDEIAEERKMKISHTYT